MISDSKLIVASLLGAMLLGIIAYVDLSRSIKKETDES